MRPLRRQPASATDGGFTLVELLVTTLIFGVVSAIVGMSLIQGLESSRRVQQRTEANQTATLALERLARHVRAAAPLASITADTIEVENVEGSVCRRYRYTYDGSAGTIVERTSPCTATSGPGITTVGTTTSRTLLRNIANDAAQPILSWTDRSGTPAVSAAQTAVVDIRVVVDPAESPEFEVRSSVTLRNAR